MVVKNSTKLDRLIGDVGAGPEKLDNVASESAPKKKALTTKKVNRYSAEFTSRVALAFLREEGTMVELAARFGVEPTMVDTWKYSFKKSVSDIIDKQIDEVRRRIKEIGRRIKEIEVRNNLFKKLDF